MGNRHCKCCSNKVRNEPQLEMATEAAVKRPWLEPLSRNGIPLLIFGFRGSSYRPEYGLQLDLDEVRKQLYTIMKFKQTCTDVYIMTKLHEMGIEQLHPDWTVEKLLESAESMRKNGGNQEQIQVKLCQILGLNEGDDQHTKGNIIYTILFERIDGDNYADNILYKRHQFSIDFLELYERYYKVALFGTIKWGGIKEQIGLEEILRCMLQKEPPAESNDAANSRKLQRNELLNFADNFDDQLLQECAKLNAKRNTANPSPDQKCILSQYMARYIRESLKIEGIYVKLDELEGLVNEITLQPDEMPKGLSDACKEFVGLWNATDKAKSLPLEQLSLQEILSLHEMVLVKNLKLKGRFRKHDVYITNSPFVPVKHRFVEEEMARFMTLIHHGTDQFPLLKENPVEFAALVHFIFVLIHPFGDGNGRMGRLLMNNILENCGYPSLILTGDNENCQTYYRAIHQACMGNVRAFVRYIAEQMLRTLRAFEAEGEYTLAHIENPSRFAKSWP